VNSVATITGASQGIGRSTTIRLARDVASIVLAARNANALKRGGGYRKECRSGTNDLRIGF
jgi:NADP-dependent 3-hydroxy acid dehydrogenase YdfG